MSLQQEVEVATPQTAAYWHGLLIGRSLRSFCLHKGNLLNFCVGKSFTKLIGICTNLEIWHTKVSCIFMSFMRGIWEFLFWKGRKFG